MSVQTLCVIFHQIDKLFRVKLTVMSFLSDYVRKLFVNNFLQNKLKNLDCMQPLSFETVLDSLEHQLCLINASNLQAKEDFLNEVQNLTAFFKNVHLIQYTPSQVDQFSGNISTWLPCVTESHVKIFFESLLSEDEGEHQLHLLQITAALERGLGNFYLIKSKPCPFLLRDLIQSEELKALFGEKIMHLLMILFGGPLSLNLRNLLWHGFLSQGELNKIYLSTVLFVLILLSLRINEDNLMVNVKLRNSVKKTEEVLLVKSHFCKFSMLNDLEEVLLLFAKSPFVPSPTLFLFQLALKLYGEKRFGDCVVVMLPRIESLLRFRYARSNSCPDRVLTAESTEFYTTIDEVLDEKLKDGSVNNLKYCLDSHILVLIMDLFTFPEGCRIRDHISHGEMTSSDLDELVTSIMIKLAVLLAHAQPQKERSNVLCDKSCPCFNSKLYKDFSESIQAYQPQFHPLSFAKRNALACLQACADEDFTHSNCDVSSTSNSQQLCILFDSMTSRYIEPFGVQNYDVATLIEFFRTKDLIILYRSLKSVLKICENSVKFTSIDVNKWDDCIASCIKLCEHLSK